MSTRATLIAEIAASFPDNTSGAITPAVLRTFLTDVVNSGLIPATDGTPIAWVSPPASSSSPGTAGQAAYDGSYLYICTAPNTWVKTATASF